MGLLQNIFGEEKIDKHKDEWVAVYFRLSTGEHGTQEERDLIHQFSDKLDEVIRESGAGVFDGDEFGNGEGGLFMYGADANRLFGIVEPLLKVWEPLRGGYVIKKYGAPDSERIQF